MTVTLHIDSLCGRFRHGIVSASIVICSSWINIVRCRLVDGRLFSSISSFLLVVFDNLYQDPVWHKEQLVFDVTYTVVSSQLRTVCPGIIGVSCLYCSMY